MSRIAPTEDEIVAAPRVFDHPTLTMITGPRAGSVFRLEKANLVGRSPECQIVVDHPGVSRRHATITQNSSTGFLIEDLGSRNGTTVRGLKITRAALNDGDRIGIGSGVTFRFALADELEATLLRRQYESSMLDSLTGAANRRHFDERLAAEIAYSNRHSTELCLLLLDVDFFKAVNDRFGHPAGDLVLRDLAAIVQHTVRLEDLFARYGGEEFAILLRGIDQEHGLRLAERVRHLVEVAKFRHEEETIAVTVSVGAACLSDCGTERHAERLVRLADDALYRAKDSGRNCCRGVEKEQ